MKIRKENNQELSLLLMILTLCILYAIDVIN